MRAQQSRPQQDRPIQVGETFHLPRLVWAAVQDQQKETHPEIPLDDFKFEVVIQEQKVEGTRPDPRCESGQRKIEFVVEFYVVVTIKGSAKKDPTRECSYKYTYVPSTSGLKSRVKAGSYKEGACK
jgi:hypothetical protein